MTAALKRSARMFVLGALFVGFAGAAGAVQSLNADGARIRYQEHAPRSEQFAGGAVFDAAPRQPQGRQFTDVIGYKNFVGSSHWQDRANKGGLTFSPRAFIKPVMFVEELRARFKAHQDGEIEPVDGLAYVPLVVVNPRIMSFMFYYRNTYGVYVHLIW